MKHTVDRTFQHDTVINFLWDIFQSEKGSWVILLYRIGTGLFGNTIEIHLSSKYLIGIISILFCHIKYENRTLCM